MLSFLYVAHTTGYHIKPFSVSNDAICSMEQKIKQSQETVPSFFGHCAADNQNSILEGEPEEAAAERLLLAVLHFISLLPTRCASFSKQIEQAAEPAYMTTGEK